MRAIRVLLVDDNAAFVQAAASAPDLVLMDMVMPGMNGLEAVLRLKQGSDAAKAVIVSLHDSESYRAGARTAGADAFVCKRDFVAEMPALLETLFPVKRS